MSQYDVYEGGSDDDLPWELREDGGNRTPRTDPTDPEAVDPGGWCVIVEYSNPEERRAPTGLRAFDDRKPPTVLLVLDDDLPNLEAARAVAERRAYEYEPPDPHSPQAREVYEEGNGFLTIVHGARTTFHFNTRVARFLGAQ